MVKPSVFKKGQDLHVRSLAKTELSSQVTVQEFRILCLCHTTNSRALRGSWPNPGIGSRVVQNVTGRVGSRGFLISRVGSGRVKSFSNLTGRTGSDQEFFKSHGSTQVGSRGHEKLTGRVRSRPARNRSLADRASMTRELFSTDLGVGPAHLTLNTLPVLFFPKGFSRTNTQENSHDIIFKH